MLEPLVDQQQRPNVRPRWLVALLGCVLAAAVTVALVVALAPSPPRATFVSLPAAGSSASAPATPLAEPSASTSVGPPASPSAGLRVIDYSPAPAGFPEDPASSSTAPLTEGAHPTKRIPAYDAPGGQARAYLAPTISGVLVTMPIVDRRADWIAVLLPSANRRIAWLGPGGWETTKLDDQLVLQRSAHKLSWYRAGALQQSWTVAVGHPKTPTPLGRSFVLGRSTLSGNVYAGVDALALGAIPDDPAAVASSLRGAHIGIHTWYRDDSFGKSVSNGCIRIPQAGQRQLLSAIVPGTAVIVVD